MGSKKESVCLQDGGGSLIFVGGSKYLFLCGCVFLSQELYFSISVHTHIHGHVQFSCISVAGGDLASPLHDIYSEGISFVICLRFLLRIFKRSIDTTPNITMSITSQNNPAVFVWPK